MITLNNIEQPTYMTMLTGIPNILKVTTETGGTKGYLSFTFTGDLHSTVTADNQYSITFLGDTISNVLSSSNAVNKNFYIANSTTSTAAYVARAFRNCPNISAIFVVTNNDNVVTLTARGYGKAYNENDYATTIGGEYISITGNVGSAYDELFGAEINVDVSSNGNYVTTLTKNLYNGECAFNVSPVLTTLAKYGEITNCAFKITSLLDGEFNVLNNIENNYVSVGYMCNQGNKWLDTTNARLAANVNRGTAKGDSTIDGTDYTIINYTTLYVYQPKINISYYNGNNGGMTIKIVYRDSAFNQVGSTVTSSYTFSRGRNIYDIELTLSQGLLNASHYVDILLGSAVLRYNVIKPLRATEYSQRIYFRNSYGGVSFFDFTGEKTETRDNEVTTYQKNIFDYYDSTVNELDIMYDNKVTYTTTLKSHLIEKDSIYLFNDLAQSKKVWTVINGQTYGIILDSVSVDETDNNNNVYEATVKYHLSQNPSEI